MIRVPSPTDVSCVSGYYRVNMLAHDLLYMSAHKIQHQYIQYVSLNHAFRSFCPDMHSRPWAPRYHPRRPQRGPQEGSQSLQTQQ